MSWFFNGFFFQAHLYLEGFTASFIGWDVAETHLQGPYLTSYLSALNLNSFPQGKSEGERSFGNKNLKIGDPV